MNDSVLIRFSLVEDGSMSKAVDDDRRLANRQAFLTKDGITAEQTVLVHLKYEGEDYHRYRTITSVDGGEGIIRASGSVSDALFTNDPGVALLLPVADCIGAVLFDPVNNVLGLAHFGRHNLIDEGGIKAIDYMRRQFGTQPSSVQAWLSPAAGRVHYPLFDFDGRSLHEVCMMQLLRAGVHRANLYIDERDTTTDLSLFSHSEFLKGNRDSDGRQAVVAMMRP